MNFPQNKRGRFQEDNCMQAQGSTVQIGAEERIARCITEEGK